MPNNLHKLKIFLNLTLLSDYLLLNYVLISNKKIIFNIYMDRFIKQSENIFKIYLYHNLKVKNRILPHLLKIRFYKEN